MTVETRQLTVVVVAPGIPADVDFLDDLAQDASIHLFHGTWPPEQKPGEIALPHRVRSRRFSAVVRSRRNHLKFVFPGLRKALDDVQPDVVHVFAEPWALFSLQVARWCRSNPGVVLVGHGCDTIWHHGSRVEQLVRRAILRGTLPRMRAYAGENSRAIELARTNGLPPGSATARLHTNPRSEVLWRPVDEDERRRARDELCLPGSGPVVGLIGRLVPAKGIRVLLESASMLRNDGVDATFVIAGSVPLEDEILRDRPDNVRFLGKLPYPEGVRRLVTALDVLACPSLSTPGWEDQAPRVVIEAAMTGCVPVGNPTGGIPEMLDGRGVVAASTSPADFAAALRDGITLASDPAVRAGIAEWARSTYSNRAVAGNLLSLWNSLVPLGRR